MRLMWCLFVPDTSIILSGLYSARQALPVCSGNTMLKHIYMSQALRARRLEYKERMMLKKQVSLKNIFKIFIIEHAVRIILTLRLQALERHWLSKLAKNHNRALFGCNVYFDWLKNSKAGANNLADWFAKQFKRPRLLRLFVVFFDIINLPWHIHKFKNITQPCSSQLS